MDREEQLVASGVLNYQELHLGAAHGLAFEPEVSADPVIDVHDVIARSERSQILEQRPPPAWRRRGTMGAVPEDLLLGDQHESFCGCHHAARERPGGDMRPRRTRS